jgi:hypothetical protein
MSGMAAMLPRLIAPAALQGLREPLKRVVMVGLSLAALGVPGGVGRVLIRIWPVPLSAAAQIILTLITTTSLTAMAIAASLEWYFWMRRGSGSAGRLVIAIGGSCAAFAVAILLLLVLPVPAPALYEYGLAASPLDFWTFVLWYTLIEIILLICYMGRKQQIYEQETRIATARQEWERARRAVLESRLQAIQARVEPQLLFDCLARMRQLYATGIQEGEVLLESLIDFLRCGLPHMRAATGTVYLECELLKSYALLMRSAEFSMPILHCDLDPDVAPTTIAAGGLQGLVGPWLRKASPDNDELFNIVARKTRDGVRITITGPASDLTVESFSTRQTLREIHGPLSSVTHRDTDGRLEYRLEYPDSPSGPIRNLPLAHAHG